MPDIEARELVHVPDEDVSLLSLIDNPVNVLAQAKQVAETIMKIIGQKKKQVVFNGEKYFENDDWVMAGRMYGITVRIVKDEYVEFGNVKGFQSEAEAYSVTSGQVIGRAFAMCLDDEDNWGERPKYEWKDVLNSEGNKIWEERMIKGVKKSMPKSEKVQVGSTKVPLFQLRSMSQTRASSKVLSMLLKFVPVLAGFKPTPAEEVSESDASYFDSERSEKQDRPTRAKRKADAPTGQQTAATGIAAKEDKPETVWGTDPDCITKEQGMMLWKLARGVAKFSDDETRTEMAKLNGKDGKPLQSTKDMLKKDYEAFINSLPNVKSFPEGATIPTSKEPANKKSANVQQEPGANG